jgi:hypothetical protein
VSAANQGARQRELYAAVRRTASSLDEQLLIVGVLATRLACSEADVKAVRELLLVPVVRECGERR